MIDVTPLLQSRLLDLKRKLAKRLDEPGFATNVDAIRAQIAEIEAALADPAT